MKKNKNKVILFLVLIIVIFAAVVLAIVFRNKGTSINNIEGNAFVEGSLSSSLQRDIDDAIKRELENNKYSLEKAVIYMNPYDVNPLSGIIAFKTDNEESVTVTIKGKHNDDIVLNYEADTYHYLPIFGLYQDYNNIVEIKLESGKTAQYELKVNKLEDIPNTKVNVSELSSDDNGLYFITSPITMNSFAVDKYGEVRWYTFSQYYHNIEVLDNGHILIGTNEVNNNGLSTRLLEIDYLGRIYNEYNINEGYLNDFFVKNSGNILLASKNPDRNTYSDYIIEIDKNTGKIIKTTDVYKALEEIDKSFTDKLPNDFFYNSGIEYYSETDTLLLTYWGGEFVISMNYKDGSINWIFSNPINFSDNFSNVLLNVQDGFNYPKSMHSASLNGNVLKVFDNGYSTNNEDPDPKKLIGSYSSAQTYTINDNNIELTSTIDEDKKLFSYALADYKMVGDNEELVLFGRELIDFDYNKEENINNYDLLASRLMEYKDGQKVLDMELDVASYSVTKIDLSKNYTYGFEELKTHTTLLPSEKEKVTDSILSQIKDCEDSVDYTFGYSNGFIEYNVLFMKSDEAKLILVDENNSGAVYTLKVKDKVTGEKIVTDLPAGSTYILYVLENGDMYKTNRVLEIK